MTGIDTTIVYQFSLACTISIDMPVPALTIMDPGTYATMIHCHICNEVHTWCVETTRYSTIQSGSRKCAEVSDDESNNESSEGKSSNGSNGGKAITEATSGVDNDGDTLVQRKDRLM